MSPTDRLARYALVAAALPASASHAAITAQTNLNLVVNPGPTVLIDFGPGFGEVFGFQIAHLTYFLPPTPSYSSSISFDRQDAVFQFNPLNSFGAFGASHLGSIGGGDPKRLDAGDQIGASALSSFHSMTGQFSTYHDLVFAGSARIKFSGVTSVTSVYDGGDWAGGFRGFIGFTMNFGSGAHYGWFDVEAAADASQLIIHGWGFSDQPGDPIRAGQVPAPAAGGLALLALGAGGIRRKRSA